MFDRTFVRRAGLGSRLIGFCLAALVGLAFVILRFTGYLEGNIPTVLSLGLAIVSFAGIAVFVACPACRARLGWQAFQHAPMGSWLRWLLELDR